MKKLGYIFGRRIRGNLELDDDPVSHRLAQIIGPGKRIGVVQDILEQSATPNYEIGSRLVVDQRVFRYARSVLADYSRLVPGRCSVFGIIEQEQGNVIANVILGATTLTMEAVADVDADQFVNGYLEWYGADDGRLHTMHIKSNTGATAGNNYTITLFRGVPATLTGGATNVVVNRCPYSSVIGAANIVGFGVQQYSSFAGVPLVRTLGAVDAWEVHYGYYLWIQTWGPCALTPADNRGALGFERMKQMNQDGTSMLGVLNIAAAGGDMSSQQAGPIIPLTLWAGEAPPGHNSDFIMLRLAP